MFNKPLLKNNWNVYLVMVYYMRVLCTVRADLGSDDDLFFASVMCVSHGNNSIFSLSRSKRVDQCVSLFLSREICFISYFLLWRESVKSRYHAAYVSEYFNSDIQP